MTIGIEQDRLAHLIIAADEGIDIDIARLRLERSAVRLSVDAALVDEPWCQAALLAIARCASRMFRGGVHLVPGEDGELRLGHYPQASLRQVLINAGCLSSGMPANPIHIHVGREAGTRADLYCNADGWKAIVSPDPPDALTSGNVISGALAGGIAVSEAFRRRVLGDLLACRRRLVLSAWNPAAPDTGAPLRWLPAEVFLLGAGNLGQAQLFLLSLLPYANTAEIRLLLQDSDIAGPENLSIQLLTEPSWVGRKKVAAAGEFMRSLGFNVTLSERRFGPSSGPLEDEPKVALVGVDNLKARRAAAAAGFDLVIDAGLGKSAAEIFDLRLHAFPGTRTPEQVWPEGIEDAAEEPVLSAGLEQLIEQGRVDRCGAITVAGQSLGVPSTALAGSALQLGQLCRAIQEKSLSDYIDVSLSSLDRAAAKGVSFDGTIRSVRARG